MDEPVKEINEIITTTAKKGRGRPKEWHKCKTCKKFYKEPHNCQTTTEQIQEATT